MWDMIHYSQNLRHAELLVEAEESRRGRAYSAREDKDSVKTDSQKRGLTYADLAEVWGCSLPTVKRQLGQEELPLSRLLSALEWLNLTLTDLHKLAQSSTLETPKFTQKQNEFLAKNPLEFSFFMKLFEDMSPRQIAQKFKIDSVTLDKILIQLEKHDLIRVGAGGRVKPIFDRPPGVDGLLAEAHTARIIDRISLFHKSRISHHLSRHSRGLPVPKGGLVWHVGEMAEKTYEEFHSKFNALMDDLMAAAKIDENSVKKSQLKVAVVNLGFFICDSNEPDLKLATEVMDEGFRT